MNLQAHKLSLIEGLLRVNDAKLLLRVKAFLKTEITKAREEVIVPMTMKKYHNMIDRSIEDVQNGMVVVHEELKKEIGQWRGRLFGRN